MKRLKLTKGLSFSMMNFSCKKGEPFCVDDEMAKKLLSTGHFEMLGVVGESLKADESGNPRDGQPPISADTGKKPDDGMGNSGNPENPNDGNELTAEIIEKMRKDDLIALAAEKNIDIKDCSNNDERIERIKGALGLMNFGSLGFDE